jgi:diguanylate cyclase (GGDEF)-like protein
VLDVVGGDVVDRAELERPQLERRRLERPQLERSELERRGVDRRGVDRAELERLRLVVLVDGGAVGRGRPVMSAASRVWPVWSLVATLATAAAAVSWFGVSDLPGAPLSDVPLPWPALLAAFVLAELCVVHVRLGKEMHSSSLDEVPMLIGLFFVDPVTFIAVRLVGRTAVLLLHRRHGPLKLAFNTAQWWLDGAVAVVLWHMLTAGHDVLGPVGWAAAFAVVLVADLLAAVAISAAIALTQQGSGEARWSWRPLWTGALSAAVNVCLALVAVAVVVVDWRASWTLVVVGALMFLAYRGHAVLRQRQESLERLNRFTHGLSADMDVEALGHVVLEEVRGLLSADRAELLLGDSRVLSCGPDGALQRSDDITSSVAHRLRGRLPERAVLAGRNNRDAVLRAWLEECDVRDAVVVPLRVDERVVGAVTVTDNTGDTGTFTHGDLQVLEALANHAAVAIENARLAERLRGQVDEQRHQARHDALTGLPNRMHLHERMNELLAADVAFAVLLLDLDRFKDVNDTLGHAAGDQLLTLVADRLATRGPQSAFLTRLGGDEFVLLVPAATLSAARAAAALVCAAVSETLLVGNVTVSVDASVGIALAPHDGLDHSALLRRADIAMYAAKQNGTGIEVYSASIDEHTTERLALAAELRAAVAAGAVGVHYQPKVDLRSGRVLGVEALARWSHPERGFISPDEFIPMAERTGLIADLTAHVLETALAQCADWRADGLDLGVAVNLSPRVLHSAGFEKELVAVLARHAVPPAALTLEVTESSLMADVERTITLLQRLRGIGVHVSIDDLGTGYSSLAYLKRLPVDEIKLDKSFVLGMAHDPDDEAIVEAIVVVGHRLRMRVVAEGVEDEATYALLRGLGCDVAQGYFLSRPLPGAEILPWLGQWSRRPACAVV